MRRYRRCGSTPLRTEKNSKNRKNITKNKYVFKIKKVHEISCNINVISKQYFLLNSSSGRRIDIMAKKTEHLNEIENFLVSAQDTDNRREQNEKYRNQRKNYLARLQQGDSDFECYISVIHTVQGVQIIDYRNSRCLIVAFSERAVRDFMRCIPNDTELSFYFDSIYYSVVTEYLYGADTGEPSCCFKGMRRFCIKTGTEPTNG